MNPVVAAKGIVKRNSNALLLVVCLGQFMVILDVSIVNVALPSIKGALGFSTTGLQWVLNAYTLTYAGFLLLGGRASDLFGRRRMFFTGTLLFSAASLLCAVAPSSGALLAARAVQGIGAALLLPSALSIITTTYNGRQRAVALSVWGALGSAGAAAGVLLGGILTTALSWEWIFFINVPVGIAVAIVAVRVVKPMPGSGVKRGEADLAGGVALVAGLVATVLTIDGASDHGWTSARTLLSAAGAAVLLAAFALLERRGVRPLVPPATWRIRSLTASAATMLVATGILVGAFFLNTLYLQRVLDASALETGLAFLPLTLVILAGAHVASSLLPKIGSRPLLGAGLALSGIAALLLSGAPTDAAYVADLLPGFLALGFGMGLTFVSVSVAAMADVTHEDAGLASGLMTTAHELGAALGVAVLAAVAVGGSQASSVSGLVDGYGDAFLIAAAVAVVMAMVSVFAVPSVRPEAGAAVSMH